MDALQGPGAKLVRRDELLSPASSPRSSPDPDLEELLRSRAHVEFTFTNQPDPTNVENSPGHSDGEEVELRLFAAPSSTATSTQKIRLASPDAGSQEPGFLVRRPQSYYFAEHLTGEKENEYKAAAVDGDSIIDMSKIPWPGNFLPWKVSKISATGMKKVVLMGHPPTLSVVEERARGRKRKGKKSRIAIRKKLSIAKESKNEQARLAKEKEEADREKRTRKNREKKVKKKMKEQAKKLAEAGASTNDPTEATNDIDMNG